MCIGLHLHTKLNVSTLDIQNFFDMILRMNWPDDDTTLEEILAMKDVDDWIAPKKKTVENFLYIVDRIVEVPEAYVYANSNGTLSLCSFDGGLAELEVGLTKYAAYVRQGPKPTRYLGGLVEDFPFEDFNSLF